MGEQDFVSISVCNNDCAYVLLISSHLISSLLPQCVVPSYRLSDPARRGGLHSLLPHPERPPRVLSSSYLLSLFVSRPLSSYPLSLSLLSLSCLSRCLASLSLSLSLSASLSLCAHPRCRWFPGWLINMMTTKFAPRIIDKLCDSASSLSLSLSLPLSPSTLSLSLF